MAKTKKLLEIQEANSSMKVVDFVQLVENLRQGLRDLVPVGAVVTTMDEVNPSTRIGGTWELIQARFLVSKGDMGQNRKLNLGDEGGSFNHRHLLDIGWDGSAFYGLVDDSGNPNNGSEQSLHRNYTGAVGYPTKDAPVRLSYTTHMDNMPPYKVVCHWKRTG